MLGKSGWWFALALLTSMELRAEEFRFGTDLGLRPIGSPSADLPKSFTWEPNLEQAFVKAVERHVPLVVVFTNADNVRCTNFLVELGADGLRDFADKAVFVHVAITDDDSKAHDKPGVRMARQLGLRTVPHISFFPPNAVDLPECFSIEGYFPIEEIKLHMPTGIARAMVPEMTWCAPTPADLVRQLEGALKQGNLLEYADCFAEPVHQELIQLCRAQMAAGHAKRQLLAELDARFGATANRLAFVDDDEETQAELRRINLVELVKEDRQSDQVVLRIRFTTQDASGASTSYEFQFAAVSERRGWRLLPENAEALVKRCQQRAAQLNLLSADFERLNDEGRSGEFSNAETVIELATSAYHLRKSADATAKQ